MITLLTIAGSSFALGFSGACMPGPLLTVTIAETVKRGPWAGPLLIAGHALLEIVVVLLVLAGLGDLLAKDGVFAAIALVGACLLAWMSWSMLRGLSRLTLQLNREATTAQGVHPLASGALVSLANPYFTLWWATIGIGYLVVAGEAGMLGVIVFYLFHILADLTWYAFISFSVHYGRTLLSDRAYRGMVAACAVFLIGFSGYFAYVGSLRLIQ